MAKRILLSLIPVLVLCALGSTAQAQLAVTDANGDEEQALVEKWYQAYEDIIGSIHVSYIPADRTPAERTETKELKRQTILTLNNTQNGGRHGKVYLWTEAGQPIILGVIMSVRDRDVPESRTVAYEFNSLTQGRVAASRYGEVFWRRDEPGVDWKGGLTDSIPSGSRAGRLTQMGALARQYNAGKYESESMANEFRLMPRPLYRYPENTPGVTDGAIYSFAIGTDPCVLLLIEARHKHWFLACSRSNAFDIRVRKGEEVIWSYNKHPASGLFQTGAWYQNYIAERRVQNDPSRLLYSAWGTR